jgi:acyl carrier protein
MTSEQMRDKLEKIVDAYIPEGEKPEQLSDDMDLMEDLHINSAHLIDIILDIEDAFDIEISDEEAENMLTLRAALHIIAAKV